MNYIDVFGGLFLLLVLLLSWQSVSLIKIKDKWIKLFLFLTFIGIYLFILAQIPKGEEITFSNQDAELIFVFDAIRDNLFLNAYTMTIATVISLISFILFIMRFFYLRTNK